MSFFGILGVAIWYKELYLPLSDTHLYYLDLPEIEPPAGEEAGSIRTMHLWPEEIREKEDRIAAFLLQLQSEENGLQTETSDAEGSNTANQGENNKSIIAGVMIGAMCVVGGFVFICQRRKRK